MKITTNYLKNIIKEEILKILSEGGQDSKYFGPDSPIGRAMQAGTKKMRRDHSLSKQITLRPIGFDYKAAAAAEREEDRYKGLGPPPDEVDMNVMEPDESTFPDDSEERISDDELERIIAANNKRLERQKKDNLKKSLPSSRGSIATASGNRMIAEASRNQLNSEDVKAITGIDLPGDMQVYEDATHYYISKSGVPESSIIKGVGESGLRIFINLVKNKQPAVKTSSGLSHSHYSNKPSSKDEPNTFGSKPPPKHWSDTDKDD